MRSLHLVTLTLVLTGSASIAAGDSTIARTAVVATADVRTRTAISQSTDVLQFTVTDPNLPAEADLLFTAGARAGTSTQVRLLVRAEDASLSSGVLTVRGDVDAREIAQGAASTVAAEWTGGGVRSGRLRFELRAVPGTYRVPVTLHLIGP
jgi:hypothetical protein